PLHPDHPCGPHGVRAVEVRRRSGERRNGIRCHQFVTEKTPRRGRTTASVASPLSTPRPRHVPRTETTPEAEPQVDVSPRYLNRELSRLDFMHRVLSLAADKTQPLLERVRFLAIFTHHLDEFFQIRVAGLKEQAAADLVATSADGLGPREQLAAIRARVHELTAEASAVM